MVVVEKEKTVNGLRKYFISNELEPYSVVKNSVGNLPIAVNRLTCEHLFTDVFTLY